MAQSLRRVVLAAIMALVVLLFTSGAHVSRAIVEEMELPLEMEMPRVPRVEALASYTFTYAQQTNTLKMLQAFADAMPELKGVWTGSSFCDWEGVSCFGSSVYLMTSSLTSGGTLPDVPADVDGSQVMLDTISLQNQRAAVSGTLPDSWSRLTYLTVLDFSSTSVSGTLPASWSALKRLQFLSLFSTSVGGSLPREWSGMTSLTTFAAYGTQVSGVLPPEWSVLPVLTMVQLHNCKLSGSLPASWAEMPKLTRLTLIGNGFCGCVPGSWRTSRTLRVAIEPKYSASTCATALPCIPTTTTTPAPTTTTTTTPAPTTTTSTTTTTTTTRHPTTARPSDFAAFMKSMCNNTRGTADAQLNTYKAGICCSDYNITGDAWKCGDAVFDMWNATVNCSALQLNKEFICCANVDEYGNRAWVGWSCNGAHGVVSALVAVVAVVAVVMLSAM
ncbi:unspecified product [Leptomonas pyrrhocoris]|uniref:Unspecified product n=1 Tax=Leptomonas pyrrhocoris TaxID=157538 RepID=A0A0M9G008_LEPPY|nr:unspecified product [Leptomonas pyrrhocoris]KPA79585.1 unspecified product [Leptomonas pyrrhocoris]|eukprot:XP_015658024.1 unspecified product [Leptomonas pyrrhocoris]